MTARIASKEKPRDWRNRICLARSSRVAGAVRNFLCHTARARSTSVARADAAVRWASVSEALELLTWQRDADLLRAAAARFQR